MKDFFASKALELWLKATIGKYADIKRVKVRLGETKVACVIIPKGELVEVELRVEKYVIHQEEKVRYISVEQVECSREWLRHAINHHVIGRKFPLPPAAAILV